MKNFVEHLGSLLAGDDNIVEKIADLFMSRDETSFTQDIIPLLLKKYRYKIALDATACAAMSEDIERAIDSARMSGYTVKCIPQFRPGNNGSADVFDMIYKRGWL